jgi:gamma-glutamylaminecyclotransferase
MEKTHLVFVYGTLRKGHCNHHLLKDACSYGVASTEACYAMYLKNGYPYVTSSESRYPITGELYAVDDDTLAMLDKFEGHPRHYERREAAVITGEERYFAWMYFRDPPGVLMPSGDYNDLNYGKIQVP